MDNYKIPDIIIQSLFSNAKVKQSTKELESYVNNKLKEKGEKTEPEIIKLILEEYKADLFDNNPNYKTV